MSAAAGAGSLTPSGSHEGQEPGNYFEEQQDRRTLEGHPHRIHALFVVAVVALEVQGELALHLVEVGLRRCLDVVRKELGGPEPEHPLRTRPEEADTRQAHEHEEDYRDARPGSGTLGVT